MVRMSFKWTNNTNVIRKIKQYEWQNGDGWVMFKLILTANCIKNVDRIDQTYLSMFFCIVLFRKIFWMIATFSWNEHRLFQTVWDNCCSCKWVVYFCFANDDNKECKGNVQVCMQFIFFFSIFTAHVSSHTNIEHGPFRQSSKGALHTWKPRWLMQILNNKTKEKQKQTIEKAFSLCFYVFQKSIINLTHTHTRNICSELW